MNLLIILTFIPVPSLDLHVALGSPSALFGGQDCSLNVLYLAQHPVQLGHITGAQQLLVGSVPGSWGLGQKAPLPEKVSMLLRCPQPPARRCQYHCTRQGQLENRTGEAYQNRGSKEGPMD